MFRPGAGAPECLFTDYSEEAALLAAGVVRHVMRAGRPAEDEGRDGAAPWGAKRRRGSSGCIGAAGGEAVAVAPNPLRCPAVSPSGTAVLANRDGWLLSWNRQ